MITITTTITIWITMTIEIVISIEKTVYCIAEANVKSSFRVSSKIKKQEGSNKYVNHEQTKR